ncbi:T9SS type A sorting domain-containing protein [Aequorivita sp. H23M31]|uniref:T9SS type A sorting domain-containing protein n=1 Tax=Aequorivita ciconiae TaxID=2494375 RepID=A0A410G4P3_9FLAO|nr:GLUG motif-containing protein [Aequorivita sp. H23M31]QAA82252.1 T9SS type A sorting domain-containing protein [Aequorivita sp. H23M31]
MKKLNLFLVFALLVFGANAQVFPTTSWSDVASTSWYNSAQTEFTISTAEDLAGVAQLVANGTTFAGKTLNIDANIDLDGNLWTPIGAYPALFSGNVNGNGNVISNLWINLPEADFAGLFGYAKNSTISDLQIQSANIIGFDSVGSLVANLFDNGSVQNCSAVDITVTGNNNVGGLVGGLVTNSSVSKSFAIGDITGSNQVGGLAGSGWDKVQITESYSEGTVSSTYAAGGLVGAYVFSFGETSTIDNCYSRSSVTAAEFRAGGLIGGADNALLVKNSYATGTVSAPEFAGAIIGLWGNISMENVYFDTESSGMTEGVGGFGGAPVTPDITPKTTSEMKTTEMAELLNAGQTDGPWSIDTSINDGYPALNVTLSTPSIQKELAIVVYPTIFDNEVSISAKTELTSYSIFSNTGARVSNGKLSGDSASISTSSLSTGLYFIRIATENGSTVKRIIKK